MLKLPHKAMAVFALAPLLVLSFAVNSRAEQTYLPGDPYSVTVDQTAGAQNIYFTDGGGTHGAGGGGNASYLVDQSMINLGRNLTQDPTCSAVTDATCNAAKILRYNSVLPQCGGPSDTNCIFGFGVRTAANLESAATFSNYLPSRAQNQYSGNSSMKIPSGITGSLYALKDAAGNETKFLVKAILTGTYNNASKQNSVSGFNLSVVPVKVTPAVNPGPCILNESNKGFKGTPCTEDGYQKIFINGDGNGSYFYGEGGGQGADCGVGALQIEVQANFDKLCAFRIRFPNENKYFVKIRLNNPPSGWMHGRLNDANIEINKGANGDEYLFEGSPVMVPTLYKTNLWKDLPANIISHYDPESGQYIGAKCDGSTSGKVLSAEDFKNPLLRNFTEKPCASGQTGIDELNLWLPLFQNTATAVPYQWNLRTITSEEAAGANQCFTDPTQVTGIVTTNSTEYSAGPPAFDPSSGSLNYQVSSPHYMSDGTTPFKGVYNLVIRSAVARCIYKFSNAPVQATISVISEGGAAQTATTIVGEKNGWVFLKAANFEFSSPKIAVKLTQEAPIAQKPTPVQTKTAAVVTKTINCVKGKISKKVVAVNPKCPSGYSKK